MRPLHICFCVQQCTLGVEQIQRETYREELSLTFIASLLCTPVPENLLGGQIKVYSDSGEKTWKTDG